MEHRRITRTRKRLSAALKEASPQLLNAAFARNGYVRVPNQARQEELGKRYKKGYEVRLVVRTPEELAALRSLLQEAGIPLARPFQKATQIVQPLYGKQAVEHFLWLRRGGDLSI